MRCMVYDLYDLVIKDVDQRFFVNSEFWFVVSDEIRHYICEDYNISTVLIMEVETSS